MGTNAGPPGDPAPGSKGPCGLQETFHGDFPGESGKVELLPVEQDIRRLEASFFKGFGWRFLKNLAEKRFGDSAAPENALPGVENETGTADEGGGRSRPGDHVAYLGPTDDLGLPRCDVDASVGVREPGISEEVMTTGTKREEEKEGLG